MLARLRDFYDREPAIINQFFVGLLTLATLVVPELEQHKEAILPVVLGGFAILTRFEVDSTKTSEKKSAIIEELQNRVLELQHTEEDAVTDDGIRPLEPGHQGG